MNVLILHSRYLSGPTSGENRVVEDEFRLLRNAGHNVRVWQPSVASDRSHLGVAADAVWSRSASREVGWLIGEHRPDVVHVHSLYPRLSPAVLRAVPGHVPIVMTLHNFRLMCLPATYLRNGSVCEDCARRTPWRGVAYGCYRDSRLASTALAGSLVLHRMLHSFRRVDRFLAVSRFIRDKHIETGLDPHRIGVKPNFTWPTKPREEAGGPLLFMGRITVEKGLETVVRALPRNLELVVVGDGPERKRLESVGDRRATFYGSVDASEIPELLRLARALVVPSRWYEGQPRVILEAFAAGVPVLASRIGGLPELVEDGFNGYLVDPDDVPGWRRAMSDLASDARSKHLGSGAFTTWTRRFTPETAITELESAYALATSASRR